jgi:hypothetical protein
MSKIEILAVGLLQPLHEFVQTLRRALDQQMHVIGHQAVGVKNIVVFLSIARETFKVSLIVALRSEGLLPVVAAAQ